MPGRDTFYVGNNKYLKNANYTLSLGEDVYCAAYRERLILGPIDFEDGEARFSKKAVIIPSNVYFQFVDTIDRAYQSFQQGSNISWESLIYRHSKSHHIVGKYDYYNDDSDYGTRLSLCIKWFFKNDPTFNRLVEDGFREAIDETKIIGDSHYLKRGCYMNEEQLAILHTNLNTLLEFSYYETDSKTFVLELVNYVVNNAKQRAFLKEKLMDYQTMTYQSKVKLLKQLLNEMFDDKKREKDDPENGLKIFLDSLSNKVILTFSLLNYHLKE